MDLLTFRLRNKCVSITEILGGECMVDYLKCVLICMKNLADGMEKAVDNIEKSNSMQALWTGLICCSSYVNSRSKDFHYKYFKKLLRDNDLPDVRWHGLRASYTTLLLENDFSSKAVSKLMGHSEEIITVDVYGDSQELITDCTVELAEFIEDVVPDIEKEDVTDIVVDTSDFLKDIKAS